MNQKTKETYLYSMRPRDNGGVRRKKKTRARRRLEKSCAILVVQAPESHRIDVAVSRGSQIDDDCIVSSSL